MKSFRSCTGIVLPLERSNVDTDAIIPKQYLKSIRRTGYGEVLFDNWRYLEPGTLGQDHSQRRLNADFILNQERYRDACILLAGPNYGCGSSREHAVWAMLEYGFRAVLACSFADIFYANAGKNGLLPVVLPEPVMARLFRESLAQPGYRLTVDLERQQVTPEQGRPVPFQIAADWKQRLLHGLDEIGHTLEHADAIRDYERRRKAQAPWLFAHTVLGE